MMMESGNESTINCMHLAKLTRFGAVSWKSPQPRRDSLPFYLLGLPFQVLAQVTLLPLRYTRLPHEIATLQDEVGLFSHVSRLATADVVTRGSICAWTEASSNTQSPSQPSSRYGTGRSGPSRGLETTKCGAASVFHIGAFKERILLIFHLLSVHLLDLS